MHAFSFSLLELSYRLPSLPTKKLVRMRMNRQKEQSDRCYVFLKRWTVEGQERWRAAYTKKPRQRGMSSCYVFLLSVCIVHMHGSLRLPFRCTNKMVFLKLSSE
jgi:hypothetical protein